MKGRSPNNHIKPILGMGVINQLLYGVLVAAALVWKCVCECAMLVADECIQSEIRDPAIMIEMTGFCTIECFLAILHAETNDWGFKRRP